VKLLEQMLQHSINPTHEIGSSFSWYYPTPF